MHWLKFYVVESYYFALKYVTWEKRTGRTGKNQGKGRLRTKSESKLLLVYLNVKYSIYIYEEYKTLGCKF